MDGIAEFLDEFWTIGLSLVIFIIGLFIIKSIEKNRDDPPVLRFTNWIMLLAMSSWFLSYLFATRYELFAMEIVFEESVRPPAPFLALAMSVGLAVGFAVLIIFHRNMLVLVPVILVIGYIDISGNQTLAAGMNQMLANITSQGREPTEAERIWFDYYLVKPQVTRILIYIFLALAGLMLTVLSFAKYLDRRRVPSEQELGGLVKWLANRSLTLQVAARLMVVASIAFNEATIWSWRYEREMELRVECQSLYFGFLLGDPVTGQRGSGCDAPHGRGANQSGADASDHGAASQSEARASTPEPNLSAPLTAPSDP